MDIFTEQPSRAQTIASACVFVGSAGVGKTIVLPTFAQMPDQRVTHTQEPLSSVGITVCETSIQVLFGTGLHSVW